MGIGGPSSFPWQGPEFPGTCYSQNTHTAGAQHAFEWNQEVWRAGKGEATVVMRQVSKKLGKFPGKWGWELRQIMKQTAEQLAGSL